MPRVAVKIIAVPGRTNLVYRWRDPINDRFAQRSAGTANRRAAERGRARLEQELSVPQADQEILFSDFHERYKEEWLSSLAVGTRVTSASAFKSFGDLAGVLRLAQVTAERIMLWESRMRKERISEATIKGYLNHFRSGLSWAKSAQLLPEVPWPSRQRKKKAVSVRARARPITEAEYESLLAAIPAAGTGEFHDPAGWRRYLQGLWLSGLRLGESIKLSWDVQQPLSVDLSGTYPRLRILAVDKSRKDRLLPLTPDFGQLLLKVPACERNGSVFPLRGSYGRLLGEKRVGDLVRRLGERAGVVVNHETGKHASAHDLRRAFGTRWAQRVMPAVLKELMRHEAIETTMKYYVGLEADEISGDLWQAFGPGRAEGDTKGDTPRQKRARQKRDAKSQAKNQK